MKELGNGYLKDDNNIYFHTWTEKGYKDKIVKEADYETFTVIKWLYAKDKNNVYYAQKIKGADVSTFEILEESGEKASIAKDKNHVYWHSIKLKGANPATFQLLESAYTGDKNNIYYWRTPIENADADSFEVLSSGYTKDKNHVYFTGQILKEADSQTFVYLKNLYAKDKYHVYSGKELVKGADKDTFQVLGTGYYAKDKNAIYKDANKISHADTETFKIINEEMSMSKDKYHDYWQDKIINSDGTVELECYEIVNGKKVTRIEKELVVERNFFIIIYKEIVSMIRNRKNKLK
ncbi:hypothetical protein HOB30_03575 [Candidatus Falkowbacteria bacterium]|jgi:hypothetical protein|nr:hypothetical protein [Candidatus Falkowbacteria bacterium]